MSKAVVSIVGAGGKTTLMFSLAQKLKSEHKILVTTTTKIYVPKENQYDFMALGDKNFDKFNKMSQNGIYVYGSYINQESKLIGIEPSLLDNLTSYFEYVLVESDGAKQKLVKGWNFNEPVICSATTHTVGVLNLNAIGLKTNEENVHRVEEFIKITGAKPGEEINEYHLARLVFHKNGLFKSSKGRKIVFLSGIYKKIGAVKI